MTERTLRNWRRQATQSAAPTMGRPRHDERARRIALREVRRQMRIQGRTVGEGPVSAALEGKVPLRLVRFALAAWKARDRKRLARVRSTTRSSLAPRGPGALASMDAAQLGRVEGVGAKLEQVVDVASGRTLAWSMGTTLDGAAVVATLEQLRDGTHDLPLALVMDRGPENLNAQVRAWAARSMWCWS